MGKLLNLKSAFDQRLIQGVDATYRLAHKFIPREHARLLARSAKELDKTRRGRCVILGNGPSVKELEFGKFANVPTFAVNFFYKHPEAHVINPDYYAIIDSKVANGIWPIEMIDDILNNFPNVKLFLSINFLKNSAVRKFIDNPRVYWIRPRLLPHVNLRPILSLKGPLIGTNVVVSSIGIATAMGFTKIGIVGVDGDGLLREILDRPSHFYEGDKDHSLRSFESMVQSLELSAKSLWAWSGFVKTHGRCGVEIVNLCKGGIMDCMKRVSQDSWLDSTDG